MFDIWVFVQSSGSVGYTVEWDGGRDGSPHPHGREKHTSTGEETNTRPGWSSLRTNIYWYKEKVLY